MTQSATCDMTTVSATDSDDGAVRPPADSCSLQPQTPDNTLTRLGHVQDCMSSMDGSPLASHTPTTRQRQDSLGASTAPYSPCMSGRRAGGVAALRAELETLQQAVRDAAAHRRPPRPTHHKDQHSQEDLLEMLSAKERCLEFLADNLAAAELAAYAAEQRAEAAEAELSLLRQQLAGAATSTASSSLGTRSPDVSEGGSADLTVTVRLLGPAGSMCAAAAAGAPAKLSSGKLSCGGGGELRRGAPVALVLPGGPLSQAWCACPADTWVDPVAGDRQDFFTSSLRARTQRLTRLTCDSVAGCHMDSNPLWEA